jgi:hypothetical protein
MRMTTDMPPFVFQQAPLIIHRRDDYAASQTQRIDPAIAVERMLELPGTLVNCTGFLTPLSSGCKCIS